MGPRWQFNPPPHWPAPSSTPDLDWQPDPSWGPLPVGWQLWRRRSAPRRMVRLLITTASDAGGRVRSWFR